MSDQLAMPDRLAIAQSAVSTPARALVWSSARLVVVRHWWVLRKGRPWSVLVNGVFEPFLYLMSIGVGFGSLLGSHADSISSGNGYASFVAPALLATSAMNTAVNETIGTVWFRLQFEKFYESLVTTPMSGADIAVGEAGAAVVRGGVAACCFLAVLAILQMVHSWWGLLAVPAVVLIAAAFAAAGLLTTTFMKEMHHNQYVQLVMLPMFLFSATFYPLSIYPTWLRDAVAALPLYQATELLRGLTLGNVNAGTVGACGYLVAMGAGSLWWAARRFERLLAR